MAGPQSLAWLLFFLGFLPENGLIYDALQAKFQEAISSANIDGLPTLLKKLDGISNLDPSSPAAASSREMIQILALLHPGLVPDQAARFQKMRASAEGNARLSRSVKRLEILQAYYTGAAQGLTEGALARLSDAVFEDSLLGLQARADAAFQAGDYDQSDYLAYQVIEAAPYSPIQANTFLMLGLSEVYRGNTTAAARHFQRALISSPLPTLRGLAQDHLTLIHRYVRPTPGKFGELFDEELTSRISGVPEIKDPRALVFDHGKFILADREQVLVLSASGAVEESRAARDIEDVAVNRNGIHYYLREDALDLGTESPVRLNFPAAGKEKAPRRLRSLALGVQGDLLLLDEELGLLRCTLAGTVLQSSGALSAARGHLVRVDSRGYIYLLSWDRRSIQVLSKEGKLSTTLPSPAPGKEPLIQSFALDSHNHVYLLDTSSNAIQVFAVNQGNAGLQSAKVSTIPLHPLPNHKNLRVIAVSSAGEVAVTGKNEDNWVLFR